VITLSIYQTIGMLHAGFNARVSRYLVANTSETQSGRRKWLVDSLSPWVLIVLYIHKESG
jgi:hypothetical protein